MYDINASSYYNHYALITTQVVGDGGTNYGLSIAEWKLYGYEEDPPAGDTSIDTTFTSIMNTPQTTGANVYVDGNLGETFTNRVVGPTVSNTHTTYVSAEKYWELSGNVESNVTVEANTFLSGDAPHSVSMWFNSSNLEANVSNSCIFSLATEEKLDSVNLDLQSNTWHNLTYAYQGEGGSRVTYLDGRKVAEDQAEDTFGDYPPFAMTGYSQGGYVVSASGEYNTTQYNAWKAFDGDTTTSDNSFITLNDSYVSASGATKGDYLFSNAITDNTGTEHRGEWIKMEFPHKIVVSSVKMDKRPHSSVDLERMLPAEFAILGSNDDQTWYLIHNRTGIATNAPTGTHFVSTGNYKTKGFKYVVIVLKKASSNAASHEDHIAIGEITFYGHRENDLVRLPDPTRVLKYPHVALSGPAQRGYVASASSYYNSGTEPEHGFDGVLTTTGLEHTWESGPRTGSGSGRYTAGSTFNTSYLNEVPPLGEGGFQTPESSNTWTGEWLQIELPHSINTTKYVFGNADGNSQWNDRIPTSGVILGSTNGSTWNLVHQFSSTLKDQTLTISHTGYYKYFRLVGITVGGTQTLMVIPEWELYGTGVDSIPIQIGGGNIDKVANFRVYDKFIGEDQALEIWDAQKDEFGRAKSSMTLHKGRLGIGTTEPEGRLAVVDEPDPDTYGLQEFPPRAMGGDETLIEGHGIFKATSSTIYNSTYKPYHAFDKTYAPNTSIGQWVSRVNSYDDASPNSSPVTSGSGSVLFNGTYGSWIQLEMPYKIILKRMETFIRMARDFEHATSGILYGSNDGGSTYDKVFTFDDVEVPSSFTIPKVHHVNLSKAYSTFAYQITKLYGQRTFTVLGELKLFGYREQVTKQSVLHGGQLTLTKSLTVPRIGPALDADDTPRRDRLVVEYNTSTNPTFEGAVRDTSGRGNDGAMLESARYDATDKAFVFDGAGGPIERRDFREFKGNQPFTASMWFKKDDDHWGTLLSIAPTSGEATKECIILTVSQASSGRSIDYQFFGSDYRYNPTVNLGSWHHVAFTYSGGTVGSNHLNDRGGRDLYFDGVLITPATETVNTGDVLNLPNNPVLRIGERINSANHFDGSISNFKLYDCALTAQEVKTLYDMGRCDEGHHVVNFSKTRVGIGLGDGEAPTYTLDVRGQIRSQGSLVPSFTGQHKCVPEEPMETGLIVSAKKNQYVKLNGSLDTGKSAITIDESLPIVSLSSVAQDKACFGVVSSTEEANTVYRVETTNGGVISYIPKTLGDNRAIVNSVGEGAIWIVDTNGSLESGDYITTSNVPGYGQKQDGAGLMNYTVAKITMDCDFTASNVTAQTIKREETGLRTITEDVWNDLIDYDRSSNTETQYSNTLVPSAYSGQSGYVPREVTTIVDYTDGSNTISVSEWSNLLPETQNTYQSNTFTEIVDYTKFVSTTEWSNFTTDVQNTYSEAEITTYYQIQRGENVLDENGQLQWEDKTGATEAPYERRFLDASGAQTDEANAIHIAAFVGCTYHCG
jgi:hypothetical protein